MAKAIGEVLTKLSTENSYLKKVEPCPKNKFFEVMASLEAMKRDEIPKDTLSIWYKIVQREGWTLEDVRKKADAIMKKKSFGNETIRIDDFYTDEQFLTTKEIRAEVQRQINRLLDQGRRLLQFECKDPEQMYLEYFSINVLEVKLAVAKAMRMEWDRERQVMIDEIMEKERKKHRDAYLNRRKIILSFDQEKRKRLVDYCIEIGVLNDTNEKGKQIFADNPEVLAIDLTDEQVSSFG